jgi:hypothetical protein
MKTKSQALQAVESSYRFTLFTREDNSWVKYERSFGESLRRTVVTRLPQRVFDTFAANRGTPCGYAVLQDGFDVEKVYDDSHAPRREVVVRHESASLLRVGALLAIGALLGARCTR